MDVPAGPDAASLSIYEDTVEPCPCVRAPYAEPQPPPQPQLDCFWCKGTGYRLTKRIYRAKDFNEHAALAILKGKDAALESAAKTLDYAADLFLKLGHPKESAQTTAAAAKLREEAQ